MKRVQKSMEQTQDDFCIVFTYTDYGQQILKRVQKSMEQTYDDFCIVFIYTEYGHEMSKFVQRSIEENQDNICIVLTLSRLRTTHFEVSAAIRITFTLFLLDYGQ